MFTSIKFKKALKRTLLFTLLLFIVGSCKNNEQTSEKPLITVSILPQKFFVEKIAGDQFAVEVMIPPGASPASYEPTPNQIINLNASDLYLEIGYIAFEINWINKLQAEHPEVQFIDTSKGVVLMENNNEDGHGHDHGPVEPHIWTSPKNVRIIASNMASALSKKDPSQQELYQKNLEKFLLEIDSADRVIQELLQKIENRSFIIYHPALTYFARDYNLVQIPLEFEGKEPSVKYIQHVIDLAKANNTRVILVQAQFNQDEAITLEKEISGKIIPIDPLAYDWTREMIHIATQLSENL
ncbi:MAG: zinc ABC transporter substrate-binding protein [Bacteroidetes bacterium]|nr:zinc ABC transporter substrate-binding protein [Bacteroidota bacterium]